MVRPGAGQHAVGNTAVDHGGRRLRKTPCPPEAKRLKELLAEPGLLTLLRRMPKIASSTIGKSKKSAQPRAQLLPCDSHELSLAIS